MLSSHTQHRATVAVIGLGSIGGVVAACLRDADRHDVIACVRRPIDRLTLERPEGTVTVALDVLTDPVDPRTVERGPVDWVLLCTKAQDTDAAGPWLRALCGPATRIAVLQNGIDHAARVAPYAPGCAVVPSGVYYNGERTGPESVRLRHVSADDLIVPDDPDGRAFARLLDGTSLRPGLSDDFVTLMWRKLLVNAVCNPLTALTRQRQAVLRRDDMRALSLGVLEEAAAVGRAAGARLADDEAQRIMAQILTFPEEAGTSMYFDCLAGRPLEVEALTGAIVAAGDRHGIGTPLNRTLLTLLRAVSDAATGGTPA